MAFKSLVSAVSEQCQEIKQTLSSISYFGTWDASTVAECCRLSSLAEFPPKEIILGSGTGNSHTVYFILDGICRMIHYLQVETKRDSQGETKYKLYKSGNGIVNPESGSIGYSSLLFNEKHEFQRKKTLENKEDEINQSGVNDCGNSIDRRETGDSNKEADVKYQEDHHLRILQQCRKKLEDIILVNKKDATHEQPKNVNGYFIQTGFLYKGACFGLKKFTEKNFIMSETRVKCLKVPRGFLFQHNPCNIWKRILLFDSLYQPKEEKILECFRTDRKWMEGKKKLTESIASKRQIPNHTGIFDVPYSIRLTNPR